MNKLKAVYFSPSGTTKRAATHLAQSIGRDFTHCDLIMHPQKSPQTFDQNTPALFAVPVYAGRVPPVCADMLQNFKGDNTPAIALAVYGNREYEDALVELQDILTQNGFIVVAAAAIVAQHSIFPNVATGRPDTDDLAKIAAFGQKCAEVLESFAAKSNFPGLNIKGNRPYRELASVPFRPETDDKCIGCGLCAELCPKGAIDAASPDKTRDDLCIACAACIANCPQMARAFGGEMYEKSASGFAAKNSQRKEPEFFALP